MKRVRKVRKVKLSNYLKAKHGYGQEPDSPAQARLWALRAILRMGAIKKLAEESPQSDALYFLNLSTLDDFGHIKELEERELIVQFTSQCQEQWVALESGPLDTSEFDILRTNVRGIAELVDLTEVECQLLTFAIILDVNPGLSACFRLLGHMNLNKLCRVVSATLEIPENEVRLGLSSSSGLIKASLLEVSMDDEYDVSGFFDFVSRTFTRRMYTERSRPIEFLKEIILESPTPTLTLKDFEHKHTEINLLLLFLRKRLTQDRKNINILIYGPPGTGKSELARVLAQELSVGLLEVSSENDAGEPTDGGRRLRAYRTAQFFLAKTENMLVFDEIEDAFGYDSDTFISSLFGKKGEAQKSKAWMNRLLETNLTPTFWLSNSIGGIDSAFLRRFDFILEMPIPPRSVRERIIETCSQGLIDANTTRQLASSVDLSPGVVARASSFVSDLEGDLNDQEQKEALLRVIGNTLKAQGHSPLKKSGADNWGEFNPDFIHSSIDLVALKEGLSLSRQGRICLYGPPGSGKTGFARWLSKELERPLLIKSASDLFDKWLGATEQNISRAFSQAADDDAILLIDEVDSFLLDRRQAQRAWEISQVNEMLTQMERFEGLFIATTNLMDNLDPATLRRFDLKLKFEFLKSPTAWRMFLKLCHVLGFDEVDSNLEDSFRKIDRLVPGDFASCARQHRFNPFNSPESLLDALQQECVLKGGAKGQIGFV